MAKFRQADQWEICLRAVRVPRIGSDNGKPDTPTHNPACRAEVALAAIKGEKTLAQLARQHDLHPNQIAAWRPQVISGAGGLIGGGAFMQRQL